MSLQVFDIFGVIKADTSGFDGAMDETSRQTEAAFARMAAASRKYLGAGGVLWTMRKVMAESNQFNQTMADLSAITSNSINKMSKSLLQLDGALGKPIRAAETLYETVSAGIRGSEKELTNFVENAGKAAKAIRAEIYTTSNAMTTLMHAYQIPIQESNKLVDSFYTIVKEGKAHGHELARTLGLVANSASEAGLSLNEMFAAAASLSRTMTPSNAMISLNQMMNSFMGPTEKSKKAAKEFGIEMSASALKAKGFTEVLRDVHEKVGGNVEVIKSLFGNIRAARGALALTGKQFHNFIDILEEFEFAAGRGEEALAKQLDTSQAAMERMQASISKMKITVGTDLDAFAKVFYKTVDGIVSGFNRSGKAVTELLESLGASKESPFVKFFSGVEEGTKSFSRLVFYAIVAFKTFKNLKVILMEVRHELARIEAVQKKRALDAAAKVSTKGGMADVAAAQAEKPGGPKTTTAKDTIPTEQLKTELNEISSALRQATRELKEVAGVSGRIVDISMDMKTEILNIRDALAAFNREAKKLYKEMSKTNMHLQGSTEQMKLVNGINTEAAVKKLHTQVRGFAAKMEKLRATAAEANAEMTASTQATKAAYKQLLGVASKLLTHAETTSASLVAVSEVLSQINRTFVTVITNAHIVSSDVSRLSESLHAVHLAMSAKYPGNVASTSSVTKPVRQKTSTKTKTGSGAASTRTAKSAPIAVAPVSATPSTPSVVEAPAVPVPVYPTPAEITKVQSELAKTSAYHAAHLIDVPVLDNDTMAKVRQYVQQRGPAGGAAARAGGGIIGEGYPIMSKSMLDRFRSRQALEGFRTDLPDDYYTKFTKPDTSNWNLMKLREDVTRRMEKKYESNVYRSGERYAPYYGTTAPKYAPTREHLQLAAAAKSSEGWYSTVPIAEGDVGRQQMWDIAQQDIENWKKAVQEQTTSLKDTTKHLTGVGGALDKAAKTTTKTSRWADNFITKSIKGWGLAGWGSAVFGGITAWQMGWNIGLSIAEKFKFDETRLFQAIADAMVGKFGESTKEQMAEASQYNVAAMSRGAMMQIERMGESGALSERDKDKFFKQISKAMAMGTPEEAITRLNAVYTRLAEIEEQKKTLTQKHNDSIIRITKMQDEVSEELAKIRKRIAGEAVEFAPEQAAHLRTGVAGVLATPFKEKMAQPYYTGDASIKDTLMPDWSGDVGTKHRKLIEKYWYPEFERDFESAISKGQVLSKEEITQIFTKDGMVVVKQGIIDSIAEVFENLQVDLDRERRRMEEYEAEGRRLAAVKLAQQSLLKVREMREKMVVSTIDNMMTEVDAVAKYGVDSAGVAQAKAGIKEAMLKSTSDIFYAMADQLDKYRRSKEYLSLSKEQKRAALAVYQEELTQIYQEYIKSAEEAKNFGLKAVQAVLEGIRKNMEKKLGKILFMPSDEMTKEMLDIRHKEAVTAEGETSEAMQEQKKAVFELERKLRDAKQDKRSKPVIDSIERELAVAREKLLEFEKGYWQAVESRISAVDDLFKFEQGRLEFDRAQVGHAHEMGRIGSGAYTRHYLNYTDQIIANLQMMIKEMGEDTVLRRQLIEQLSREVAGRKEFITTLQDSARSLRGSVMDTIKDMAGDKLTSSSLYHSINMLGMMAGPVALQRMTSPQFGITRSYGMVDAQKAQKAVAASLDSYIMSQRYAQANIGKTVTKIYDVLKSGGSIIVR